LTIWGERQQIDKDLTQYGGELVSASPFGLIIKAAETSAAYSRNQSRKHNESTEEKIADAEISLCF
jgi:hypothetical protein